MHVNHRSSRIEEKCNDDNMLVLQSKKKKRRKFSLSLNDDTADGFIYLSDVHERDSSTGAVNEKETETEH